MDLLFLAFKMAEEFNGMRMGYVFTLEREQVRPARPMGHLLGPLAWAPSPPWSAHEQGLHVQPG